MTNNNNYNNNISNMNEHDVEMVGEQQNFLQLEDLNDFNGSP